MSFTTCYLYEAVAKYDWCKQVQTLCNLLCYMYKQTYFKEIFVNNQESQNTKQMESNWKFGESREVICPDGEMARTEPKRQNLPVQSVGTSAYQMEQYIGCVFICKIYL